MEHHAAVPSPRTMPTDPMGNLVTLVGSMPDFLLAVLRPVFQAEGALPVRRVVVSPEGNHGGTRVSFVAVCDHRRACTALAIEADAVSPREEGLHVGNDRVAGVAQSVTVGPALQPPAPALVHDPVVGVVVQITAHTVSRKCVLGD